MEMTLDGTTVHSWYGSATSAPRGSRRPVDLVHLARYTLGDHEAEHEILELFRTQSKIYLSRLNAAESVKAWRDAAHTIRDSARGIGAWRVASMAETAEAFDDHDIATQHDEAVEELSHQIEEANGYIAALLDDS